jgi:hypothetical protein
MALVALMSLSRDTFADIHNTAPKSIRQAPEGGTGSKLSASDQRNSAITLPNGSA